MASASLDFNEAASDTPPFDPDGSLLTTTMQAVQSRYQDVFEDNDHTITINYWWDDLANLGGIHSLVSETGGNNSRETEANLRFDTRIGSGGAFKQYFFDSTPLQDEEFTMAQVLYGTGLKPSQKTQFFNGAVPSLLEVGYTGTAIPGGAADGLRDILSLAFHETGHALGMSASNDATVFQTQDGDYDFNPNFVAGNNMAANILFTGTDVLGHLDDTFSVMFPGLSLSSARTLPSATDIFSMASGHQYVNIDLARQDFMTGSDWNTASNWEGNQVPLGDDDVWVRHGGNVNLSADAHVDNLTVVENSYVFTGGHKLDVDTELIVGDGASTAVGVSVLDAAGALEADSIAVRDNGYISLMNGGTLSVAGETKIYSGGTITLGSSTFTSGGILLQGGSLAASTEEGEAGALFLADVGQVTGYGDISLMVHLGDAGQVTGSGGTLAMTGGLSGSGGLQGVTLGGNIEVGNSPGALELEDVVIDSGATFAFEIGEANSSEYDNLLLAGDVTLSGNLVVKLIDNFLPQPGDQFNLLRFQPNLTLAGTFIQMVMPVSNVGYWDTDNLLVAGSVTFVPEPSAFLLLAMGGLFLSVHRKRRK